MKLTTDRLGNSSFGDDMIRTADGRSTHCRECGQSLGPADTKLRAEVCGECVEKQPVKPKRRMK